MEQGLVDVSKGVPSPGDADPHVRVCGGRAGFIEWAYPIETTNARTLITTDDGGYDWGIELTNGTWSVRTGLATVNTGVSANLGFWQHVAAVFDRAGGEVRFYKNGVETVISSMGTDTSDNNVRIGQRANGSYNYVGRMDDVRVYNAQLTQPEIMALVDVPG